MHKAEPFDRVARRRARDRAAPRFADHAFLKDALAEEVTARLAHFDLRLDRVLDVGAHDGRLARSIAARHVVASDAGFRFAKRADGVMCDEDLLPFADGAFDAVVSAGSLHGVNDLPGALVQLRRTLRPGGVLIASFIGGFSMQPLRAAMLAAEEEETGGVSPRLLPMVDAREAPSLLQRAGFADPVVDVAGHDIAYRSPAAIIADIRGMGEGNILAARTRHAMPRPLAQRMLAAVEALRGADDRIHVPIEVLTLTGRVR